MISIVIPVYNGEKYIADCIDSCLDQTYDDIEIIVCNDGSTDKTLDIVASYVKEFPHKIRMGYKVNGGTASALNMGIHLMKGDWFKWLSADDMLYPTALEDMMKEIIQYQRPKNQLFYTDYDIVNEDGFVTGGVSEKSFHDLEIASAQLYHSFYGNGSTILIHKTMFEVVGLFREGMPFGDDYEFWLRWTLKYKLSMCHIPITTLKYRTHSQSLTSLKDPVDNKLLDEKLKLEYYPYLSNRQKKYLKTLKLSFKKRIGRRFPKLVRLLRH